MNREADLNHSRRMCNMKTSRSCRDEKGIPISLYVFPLFSSRNISINHCFCSTQENDEICNIIICESVSYHDLAALVYMTQSSLS